MKYPLLVFSLAAAAVAPARAGDPPVGAYSIFRPAPRDKLRDFDADRPDQAVGAHTVDAGHVYLELDFANYTRDRHSLDGTATDQWNVAPVNLRLGLWPSVELDLQYDGYTNLRTRDPAGGQTRSGAGDLSLRSKINLFGNDGGHLSVALVPLLRLPTSTAGLAGRAVEGGAGVAVSARLPGGFSLTASAEVACVRNSRDAYYVVDSHEAVSISHELGIKEVSGFVEFAGEVSSESPSAVAGQVDAGVLWQISDRLQLDVDCYFGVTRNAPDFVPFAGLAVRY